ncbi:hypothetical protein [Ferrimonas marina]|uniref:Uncharacterized protein n=1 Tax=Ferrimonas marina TaxID=299255 RepID=A0A1M5U2E0_9GAMM|nr:hypothetical protein [Ferrimonas marina]SHH57159.1 hypothetical protein SAMN02745129_2378 [Ferrimonas marina]
MKKSCTFIAMALLSSGAAAASLDVHGEIRVNGQTVINADGSLVGYTPVEPGLQVDPSAFDCDGKVITREYLSGSTTVHEVEDCSVAGTYKRTVTDTQQSGYVITSIFEIIEEDGGISQVTNSYTDSDGGAGMYSYTSKHIGFSDRGDGLLTQGVPSSYHYKVERSNFQCTGNYADWGYCENRPTVVHYINIDTLLAKHNGSFEIAGQTFDKCYLTRFESMNVSEDMPSSGMSVQCEGVGVVDAFETGMGTIVDIQTGAPTPALMSASSSNNQLNRMIADGDRKEQADAEPRYPWILNYPWIKHDLGG